MATSTARGRHSAPYQELDARARQLEARIRQLEADNAALTASNEDLTCALTAAVVRACQDTMRIAVAEEENTRLRARVKQSDAKVIRAAVEQQRLRQAVINARPRITVAEQQLDRPYVSHVALPYRVPVGRSTANDETQQLAVIDRPEPVVAAAGAVPVIAEDDEQEPQVGEAWPVYATASRTTWGVRNQAQGVA